MPVISRSELGPAGLGRERHGEAIFKLGHRDAVVGRDLGLTFALDDLQHDVLVALLKIHRADHGSDAVVFPVRRRLEHVATGDLVVQDHAVVVQAEPLPLAPVAGQRAVRFLVEPAQAGILKIVRARFGPAGGDRVGEQPLADELRVSAVAAIVNNAAPVDELVAAPGRRHAQCVRLEHHEFVAL